MRETMTLRLALAAVFAAALAQPALASERRVQPNTQEALDHARVCARGSGQDSIDACTFMIRNVKLKDRDLAVSFINRGVAYHLTGRVKDALFDFNQALTLDPDSPLGYYDRASAYAVLGANARAIADYSAALSLKSDYTVALLNRGRSYADAGAYDRALADYNAYLAIRADDASGFKDRAVAQIALGRRDAGLADFDTALRLEPDYAEALAARGAILTGLGRYDAAIADLDRALALKPDSITYNSSCWARAATGRELEHALADCNKALLLRPFHPGTLNSRGLVKYRLGHYADALADYTEASNRDAKDTASLYMRGVTKLKTGDASGNADIQAATTRDPKVAERYASYGVKP